MIIITGSIVSRQDTFDELRRESLAHVTRSRGEDGCLHHSVQVDCENPLRLVFVERWSDRAAVLAHFAVPASRAFSQTAGRLAASPPSIEIYDATEHSLKDLLASR